MKSNGKPNSLCDNVLKNLEGSGQFRNGILVYLGGIKSTNEENQPEEVPTEKCGGILIFQHM
jgi:hypothetical protein